MKALVFPVFSNFSDVFACITLRTNNFPAHTCTFPTWSCSCSEDRTGRRNSLSRPDPRILEGICIRLEGNYTKVHIDNQLRTYNRMLPFAHLPSMIQQRICSFQASMCILLRSCNCSAAHTHKNSYSCSKPARPGCCSGSRIRLWGICKQDRICMQRRTGNRRQPS